MVKMLSDTSQKMDWRCEKTGKEKKCVFKRFRSNKLFQRTNLLLKKNNGTWRVAGGLPVIYWLDLLVKIHIYLAQQQRRCQNYIITLCSLIKPRWSRLNKQKVVKIKYVWILLWWLLNICNIINISILHRPKPNVVIYCHLWLLKRRMGKSAQQQQRFEMSVFAIFFKH